MPTADIVADDYTFNPSLEIHVCAVCGAEIEWDAFNPSLEIQGVYGIGVRLACRVNVLSILLLRFGEVQGAARHAAGAQLSILLLRFVLRGITYVLRGLVNLSILLLRFR